MPRVWEIITIGGTESLWIRFLLKSMRVLRVVLLRHYWLVTDRWFLCFSPFLYVQFSLSSQFLILLALKENLFWKFKSTDSFCMTQSGTKPVHFLSLVQIPVWTFRENKNSVVMSSCGQGWTSLSVLSNIRRQKGSSCKAVEVVRLMEWLPVNPEGCVPRPDPAPQKMSTQGACVYSASGQGGKKLIQFWIQLTMPGCLQRRSISHLDTLALNVKCFFY